MLFRSHFSPFCTEFCKATKRYQMHPNSTKCTKHMSLGPNGVNRVCSLRKIMTRLCGTNFCTSSARFTLCFVRQPNGSKYIQIVRNTPKHLFGMQWDGSGAFVAKNSDATSWHERLHQFGPFCTKCCNTAKLSQLHSNSTNAPKHEVRVQ